MRSPRRIGGEDALEAVQRSLGAVAMLLLYCDLAAGNPYVVEATGFDRKSLDVYTADHLCNDELIRESINGPAGIVVSSSRHYRGKRFYTTDIFRLLLRPSNLLHIAGAAALNTSRVYASLWMARSDGEPDFSVHDLHLFSGLLPHFGRVMAVHHRVRRAEIQADMAVGAFDRVAVGVVLLDVRGAPVIVNREARRIVDQKDGFSLLADRLAASEASQTKELRNLVHRVSWVGPAGNGPAAAPSGWGGHRVGPTTTLSCSLCPGVASRPAATVRWKSFSSPTPRNHRARWTTSSATSTGSPKRKYGSSPNSFWEEG